MSWTRVEAETALLRAGLDPGRFDLDATAAELADRAELNSTLDQLLADRVTPDPAGGFDPRWER